MTFTDRTEAGRRLAEQLSGRIDGTAVVLALPRGGVPVAAEVAGALGASLDVIGVRKVGAPGHPELGVGAVAEGGGLVLDQRTLRGLGLTAEDVAETVESERREVLRRVTAYRGDRPLPDVTGRTVVIVDDGLATGVTAKAAVRAVRAQGAAKIVLAVPVCSTSGRDDLVQEADEVVCVMTPDRFGAVGYWYSDFGQTTDEEVLDALRRHGLHREAREDPSSVTETDVGSDDVVTEEPVLITTGDAQLHGDLTVPARATGVVLFAHGSGSSRHSPRNRQVADALNRAGLATLLLDLLTTEEERVDRHTREHRFDIGLLADRLAGATRWLSTHPATAELPVGYFGASTGAAAALVAAATLPDDVAAVVSRGGRPDLAGDALPAVRAPVLLIVGGADTQVLELNRDAARRLHSRARISVVPGAGHLFEEAGALEDVADLAGAFLTDHLTDHPTDHLVDAR